MNSPLRGAGPVRGLVCAWLWALGVPQLALTATPIDRQALVGRHAVRITSVDPEAPLSVGNGDFAFTVDVTGLQSLGPEYHENGIPLETLSTWGWHSFPNPDGLRLEDSMVAYPFHQRTVRYAARQDSPAGKYFRENPHPIPLGQISLLLDGRPLAPAGIANIDQQLDLWTGVIRSRYMLGGEPVAVETVAHPELSQVAVRLQSPLLSDGRLQVRFRFPYSHQVSVKNKPPLVWDRSDAHRTDIVRREPRRAELRRTIDDAVYHTAVAWEGNASLGEAAPHDFRLRSEMADTLTFTCAFSPSAPGEPCPDFAATRNASARGWSDYWMKGGAVDFAGSRDVRAAELERRVVLSLYLMRVHYGGSFPPSEAGLVHPTWYGKHNSEMYFWHAAQFYQWGHVELLEKGLGWYLRILPRAKADAAAEGFEGARWPKMAGVDGRASPGTINPFIIWNQPNPIYLGELVYRARPNRETLERYQDLVFESARFLASFAQFDPKTSRYVLGPPIKNVSENAGENLTQNPTFELAYWHYGLQTAQAWRTRLGLRPEPRWAEIIARLAKLPVSDGKYVEIESFPNIFKGRGGLPTSMLMALGFLPRTDKVDPEIVRATFDEINRRSPNGTQRWVSWSLGQAALTAARLGEAATAVDIVTNPSPAARFMASGHVRRPKEPRDCPAYLPVNASLLSAVGLMAGGWDGAPGRPAPGFPDDGSWTVRVEGLNPMP